jgi:peptidoglycan hydrolase-like protein with peptidoglycan-binding domain
VRRILVAGAAVTVVAVGGTAAVLAGGGDEASGQSAPVAMTTADVTRGDLVDTESVDGTLGYADEREVRTGASGTVTWAPDEGATVKRGGSLLRVDGAAVSLMYGATPLYRPLSLGVSDGADVRQLESNLKALGHGDDLTVDDEFTSATAQAVRDWQDDRGLPETGSVDAGQVVFLPGAVRIKKVNATVGARTSQAQPALTATGTRRLVHVDLDADKQDLARKGATVSIELPGGRSVKGKIVEVGTVAEQSGAEQDQKTTVSVDISLGKSGTGRLDEAPVTVELESERRKDVLSVPIEALLALREGGFGVEVVEGTAKRVVPVTTGSFGGGRVEVSGDAIREGMKVGVPAK